jgi:AcrR family transcriptional regulator
MNVPSDAARTADAAPRRERADARRNRERVLAAAQAVFAEEGPDASLEEIARRAEVGIGTLYRHFPNRQALLEGVFRDRVTALCDQATELIDGATPLEALRTWLRAQLAHATTYGSLAASTMLESLDGPPLDPGTPPSSCESMRQAGSLLLARAQAAGEVRDDIVVDDVLRLVGALALAADDSPEGTARADRLFALMMDGLLPRR